MGKNRDHISLLAALLHAASKGSSKTRIMYDANLSYRLLEKYLEEAVDYSLLQPTGSSFFVTEKGVEFLKRFSEFSNNHNKVSKIVDELALERESLEQFCINNCAKGLPVEHASSKTITSKRFCK